MSAEENYKGHLWLIRGACLTRAGFVFVGLRQNPGGISCDTTGEEKH